MTPIEKAYSGVRARFRKIGKSLLIVTGFFLIFFTVLSRVPRSQQTLSGSGISNDGIAHADAPSCGGDSADGGGGDSG